MNIALLNLAIALTILVLVLVVVWLGRRQPPALTRYRSATMILLGLTMASLGVVTAASRPLGLTEYNEVFRFTAAALRTVALVLLLAYAWHRWLDK